mgnify:FL=1
MPVEVGPTLGYLETFMMLDPKGQGFDRQKKLAEIHAQAIENLKQTQIIDKTDEFLKHQRYSKLVEIWLYISNCV